MKKIPTVLVRDPENRARVLDEITPGCEWVVGMVGNATRKYDGTCTMLDADGKWWARREVKDGKEYPPNFLPEDHDPATGKTFGWEPIEQSPFANFHAEALEILITPIETPQGTYELIGPKINGRMPRTLRAAWTGLRCRSGSAAPSTPDIPKTRRTRSERLARIRRDGRSLRRWSLPQPDKP